jgi:hypothetical protein
VNKLRLFNKSILKNEEISLNSMYSILKAMESRLNNVEHQLWNMRLVLNEVSRGKSELILETSEISSNDINSKINYENNEEEHIRQAKDFIKTMMENDKHDMLKNSNDAKKSIFEFMPKLENDISELSSPQKFFKELDSENLLSIFKKVNIPKTKINKDHFSINLPDIKIRRSSSKSKITTNLKKTKKQKTSYNIINLDSSKKAPIGKEFFFNNGKVAKNIKELYNHLKSIDNNTYNYHVNQNKNDFALWIKDSLGYDKITGLIILTKSKDEFINLLKNKFSLE